MQIEAARIYAVANLLTDYPHMGHDGHVPGTFEMVVARLPIVIIYRIDYSEAGSELIVLRVYHTARHR